jgi:hypothetical protein
MDAGDRPVRWGCVVLISPRMKAKPQSQASRSGTIFADNDLEQSTDISGSNTDLIVSEGRVNVDRCWWGMSVRVRFLLAALALLAAAGLLLSKGTSSRSEAANASAVSPVSSPALEGLSNPSAAVPVRDPKLAHSLLSSLPLVFEPNRGQGNLDPADERARFVARGSGYSLFLGTQGAILSIVSQQQRVQTKKQGDSSRPSLRVDSLEMKLAGSNPNPVISGDGPLPGKSNYFIGNDPGKWRTGVPQFARVRYENVYPGINLAFYGNHGRLEFDLQVAPGADPAQAELEFDAAKSLKISDGALLIQQGRVADLRFESPHVYQLVEGRERPIEGRFVLRGAHRAGFEIGAYDHSRELVIDPVPTFSSYFGGSGDEHSSGVAVDGAGNIYLTGSTTSANIPDTAGFFQVSLAGTENVYVAKITPSTAPNNGSTLVYATYLGGNGSDTPAGIAVDGANDAYLAGTTSSTNFPTTPFGYQTAPEAGSTGTQHVFVTELDPLGATLKYSSYLSGSGNDLASGMTIDFSGNLYVTGTTTSTLASDVGSVGGHQFPSSSLPFAVPFQSSAFSSIQFFVTKVNTTQVGNGSIAYSTYFGGGLSQTKPPLAVGGGIAVDQNQIIYFSGTTNFTFNSGEVGAFPILNAFQPCLNQYSPTVITNPPPCTNTSGATDAFLAKLNPAAPQLNQGGQLVWSTYLGGSGTDSATGIALDPGAVNVYLIGTTNSTDITPPTITAPFQICLDTPVNPASGTCTAPSTSPTPSDAFIARFPNLAPTSTNTNLILDYFSFLGGTGNDAGLAIAADNNSGALVTGWTQSTDFPTYPAGEIQTQLNGAAQDAFVARINTIAAVGANQVGSWSTYFGGTTTSSGAPATGQGTSIAIDPNQNTYFAGDTNAATNLLLVNPLAAAQGGSYNGGYDAFVSKLSAASGISVVGIATLGTNQAYFSAGVPATFTYTITNTGPDLATTLTFSDNLNPAVTGVPLTFGSASATAGTCGGASANFVVTCAIGSLQAGSTAQVTVVVTPTPNPSGIAEGFNGGTVQVLGQNNIVLATTSVSAQMSDFAISVNPASQSVPQAGLSAVYQVLISPHPVFGTNVALSCANNPTATTCVFTPSSVTLSGAGPAGATLTITTTARPIITVSNKHMFDRFFALWLFVPGVVLIGVGATGGKRRHRLLMILLLALLLIQVLPLPGCSTTQIPPPAAGTPAGTYPVTITGTAGSDSKSQAIYLTVP